MLISLLYIKLYKHSISSHFTRKSPPGPNRVKIKLFWFNSHCGRYSNNKLR